MNRPALRSARAAALKVLRQYHAYRGDAAELLRSLLDTTDRSGQATDLVYGVIRNTILLDRLLEKIGTVKKSNVKPALWAVLRLGAYELVFAPKTADYAILNEAANLAHRVGSRKAVGFVNAVLRAVQRQIAVRDTKETSAVPAQVVPRSDRSACVFAEAVLPDPALEPVEYLHTAWSLPVWLVRDWLRCYGSEAAADVCRACNRAPSVYAWPDIRRVTAEKLCEKLIAEDVQCRLWAERGAVCIHYGGPLANLKIFQEGLFYIQDPAAESVAAFLDPQPGATLVDVCAAPGGKTIALALKMRDSGCILASDVSDVRLKRVDENIRRLGLSAVQVVGQAELGDKTSGLERLNAVLLDVPCSNTGVLARRIEARRRLEGHCLDVLLKTQQSLLEKAKPLLRPGTKLLYSTCSIQPEENEHQIQQFLAANPQVFLIKQQLTLPSTENGGLFDHDGGYFALLALK